MKKEKKRKKKEITKTDHDFYSLRCLVDNNTIRITEHFGVDLTPQENYSSTIVTGQATCPRHTKDRYNIIAYKYVNMHNAG